MERARPKSPRSFAISSPRRPSLSTSHERTRRPPPSLARALRHESFRDAPSSPWIGRRTSRRRGARARRPSCSPRRGPRASRGPQRGNSPERVPLRASRPHTDRRERGYALPRCEKKGSEMDPNTGAGASARSDESTSEPLRAKALIATLARALEPVRRRDCAPPNPGHFVHRRAAYALRNESLVRARDRGKLPSELAPFIERRARVKVGVRLAHEGPVGTLYVVRRRVEWNPEDAPCVAS